MYRTWSTATEEAGTYAFLPTPLDLADSSSEDSVPAWESGNEIERIAAQLMRIDSFTTPSPSDFFNEQVDTDESFNYRKTNPRFKTEFCRNFREKGECLYGDLCQFAHGKVELRQDPGRHQKYKTKFCQKYWIAGWCAYGPRCNFIHEGDETGDPAKFNKKAAGLRPFNAPTMRFEAEKDSGLGSQATSPCFSMPPPRIHKTAKDQFFIPPLQTGLGKEMKEFSLNDFTPDWNRNLSEEINRNFPTKTSFCKDLNLNYNEEMTPRIMLGERRMLVPHPEDNPLRSPEQSTWKPHMFDRIETGVWTNSIL